MDEGIAYMVVTIRDGQIVELKGCNRKLNISLPATQLAANRRLSRQHLCPDERKSDRSAGRVGLDARTFAGR
jgi:hypothetical protein